MTELSRLRVLVVDDQTIMRMTIGVYLRRLGITNIATVCSGFEALAFLKMEAFDLVTSDLDMPGMTGLELLKTIKSTAQTSSIPVLIVSGENGIGIVTEVMSHGAAGYVPKSELWSGLRTHIKTLFGKSGS